MRAIVIGISGQDGSYMAEFLLSKGYDVLGTSRNAGVILPYSFSSRVKMLQWNLRDEGLLQRTIEDFQPDEIYNFAAYSSGAGMFELPVEIGDINGLAVTRILSVIARSGMPIRFCQASSSEVFGDVLTSPQDESTVRRPRTPYGSAKLYADSIVNVFRRSHSLFACSAILFNHESPRRRPDFVTAKVADAVARIAAKQQHTLAMGSLEARRDWGHARDYVEAMWLMLQQPNADDFVIATGITHSIAELCDRAFSEVKLRFDDHVRIDPAMVRVRETGQLVGDAGKARRLLGWSPRTSFDELVGEMVRAALVRAGTDAATRSTTSPLRP